MQYHAKAVLTAAQRTQVRQLHQQGRSQAALARQFDVHRRTIQRWVARDEPTDRSSAPHHHGHQVVTEDYRKAVLDHRAAHPTHGPKRIAYLLRDRFPTANAATVWRILHSAGVSRRTPPKTGTAPDSGGPAPRATGHPGVAGDPGQPQA